MAPKTPESPSRLLTPANIAASKMTHELCQIIVKNHPQVEQDYRDGMTCREIAVKYNLGRDNHVGIRLAIESVRNAVKIMIPDREERMALAERHTPAPKDGLKK